MNVLNKLNSLYDGSQRGITFLAIAGLMAGLLYLGTVPGTLAGYVSAVRPMPAMEAQLIQVHTLDGRTRRVLITGARASQPVLPGQLVALRGEPYRQTALLVAPADALHAAPPVGLVRTVGSRIVDGGRRIAQSLNHPFHGRLVALLLLIGALPWLLAARVVSSALGGATLLWLTAALVSLETSAPLNTGLLALIGLVGGALLARRPGSLTAFLFVRIVFGIAAWVLGGTLAPLIGWSAPLLQTVLLLLVVAAPALLFWLLASFLLLGTLPEASSSLLAALRAYLVLGVSFLVPHLITKGKWLGRLQRPLAGITTGRSGHVPLSAVLKSLERPS